MWFVFSINPFSHHQCKSQGFINVLHSTLSVSRSPFRSLSTRELSSSNLSVLNNILFVCWGRVYIWMRQPQLKSPDWDVYAVFCCMPVCEWDRDSSVAIVFHLSDIYLIGRLIIKVKHFFPFHLSQYLHFVSFESNEMKTFLIQAHKMGHSFPSERQCLFVISCFFIQIINWVNK